MRGCASSHPREAGARSPGRGGIRLVDTPDKSNPAETSFYLPNANKSLACNQNCYFQGRETWGAYFYDHTDPSQNTIYASDFWLGFFIVQPR